MKTIFCTRCRSEVPIPDFQEADKKKIRALVRTGKVLDAVKFMKDELHIEHRYCKLIADHFPKQDGTCHRCGYDQRQDEIETCLKCDSVNINL